MVKNLPIFADKLRYLPFKVLSQKATRSYLIRKSGAIAQTFSFRNDLSDKQKRLMILPISLARLSLYLPFLQDLATLAKESNLSFLCHANLQPLLKCLDLDKFGFYYNQETLRYGNPDFQQLDEILLRKQFEVVCMLEPQPSLLLQYLAKSTRAPVRIGFDCEEQYPFLNISFRGPKLASSFKKQLEGLFRITPSDRKHPLAHHSAHLSSQHVILLNLEASLSGKSWTLEELTQLSRILDPHFRLLALAPNPALIEQYSGTLEKLAIRIAPIANSYAGFLDLLKQYCGLVSLNSEHAQLAMHVSRIPTILLNDPNLSEWTPEHCADVHVFERKERIPDNIFSVLTSTTAS